MNNTRFYKVFKSLLDKMSSDGYSREANYLDSKFLKLSKYQIQIAANIFFY